MRKTTLQSRIIILITIFTIVMISVFVSIQLTHEVNILNRYKKTQGRLVVLAIENTWDKIKTFSLAPEEKISFLKRKIDLLKEKGSLEDAKLFNTNKKVFFSTLEKKDKKINSDDLEVIKKIRNKPQANIEPVIDRKGKIYSLFLPLPYRQGSTLIVRLYFSLADITTAMQEVYEPAFLVGILFVIITIGLGIFLSRLVIGPIKIFNEAAKKISSGRLDLKVKISTGDELQELADAFNSMVEDLSRMKKRAENANPLTKLPGNIVIMEEVEKRIEQGEKFVVIYCDLDNFKAFNDKYGIHKGDQAIQLTGQIFKEALEKKGASDDFVGHEGGDDFLILTSPQHMREIAQYIISEFDKRVREFYDGKDLERGHIVAHDREGNVKRFPIMSISLAGVTNQHREIETYAEVTNIAAGIKKKAKNHLGSCFVIDKRKG
ncbi:MAG: diguanylate cyclase [Candidatus Omnitrophota bacterium]